MIWRQGRHYGIHVYEQHGDEPGDLDRPLGTFLRVEDAQDACAAMNSCTELLVLQARVADALTVIEDMFHRSPEYRSVVGPIRTLLTDEKPAT